MQLGVLAGPAAAGLQLVGGQVAVEHGQGEEVSGIAVLKDRQELFARSAKTFPGSCSGTPR